MADLTDDEKAALAEEAKAKKAAAKAEAKSIMKEALKEFADENKPKQRTTQPERSILQTLFGI
jgi:recombinational DNA repair protein (RecF pathway)